MPVNRSREYRSTKSLPRLWTILLVGGLAIVFAYALRPTPPATGNKLSTLQLQGLVGATGVISREDLLGKVVLINFWGTWCGPCRMELPHLVELNQRLADQSDFRFLPVSCGVEASSEQLELLQAETTAYLEQAGFDLPVYADADAVTRSSVLRDAQLDGFAYPTTILLDRAGVIRGVWRGYRPGSEKQMETTIQSLLKA